MLYNMPLLSDRYTNAEFERNFFDQTGSRTAGLGLVLSFFDNILTTMIKNILTNEIV